MEDSMDIVIILIGIITAIVSSVKKNKKKQVTDARKKLANQHQAQPPQKKEPIFTVAGPEAPAVPAMSQWPEPQQLTFTAPRPAAPVIGPEGVDACHEYMLSDLPEEKAVEQEEASLSPEQARDLVNAFIFSEIMARPQSRFAGRHR